MPLSNGSPAANRPWLTLPPGWDACWRAGLANAAHAPCWLAALGDSTTQGINCTDVMKKTWLARLRDQLAGRYGLYGDFYGGAYAADYAADLAAPGGLPFVVSRNGGAREWLAGDFSSAAKCTAAEAPTVSFTTPDACHELSVYQFENWAGTWQLTIDGAVDGETVATAHGSTIVSQSIVDGMLTVTLSTVFLLGLVTRVQVTGLAQQVHQVVAGGQSADYVMEIAGCSAIVDPGRGVGFVWSGRSGSQAGGLGWRGWQGQVQGAATGLGFPAQPHLAIVEVGINDCAAGVTPEAYATNLAALIRGLRRGRPGCSVLLIGQCNPDPQSSDAAGTFAHADQWHLYLAQLAAVGQAFGCAVLNLNGRWGETPVAAGFTSADNQHPTDAGHADVAAALTAVLL